MKPCILVIFASLAAGNAISSSESSNEPVSLYDKYQIFFGEKAQAPIKPLPAFCNALTNAPMMLNSQAATVTDWKTKSIQWWLFWVSTTWMWGAWWSYWAMHMPKKQ